MFAKNVLNTRTAACTGVAVLALVAVAGCGSSKSAGAASPIGSATVGGAPTSSSPSQSATATATALPPAAEIQAILGKTTSDQSVTVAGTSTSKNGTSQFSGQEQFGDNFAMQMNVGTGNTSTTMILTTTALYMKSAQMAALAKGKAWVEIAVTGSSGAGSLLAGDLNSIRTENPTQQLQALLASDNLKDVGPATVNGQQTEHYSGTIDPSTTYSGAAASKYLTPAQVQTLVQADKTAGITSEDLDVWVGSNGLPAEVKASSQSSVLGATTSDMLFTNWGGATAITAPPASEVADISSLLGGAQ
jgi:hypothetical protein